jgi:3-carboxy-cis,cis-muconate cycloisomerase
VRQQVAALLDAMLADHERSTGPWEIEWIALPEAFLLSAGALNQAKAVVGGLEVDAKRMRANLDSTKGLVVSEAVMMGLAPYLGRERAHDLVYDLCREAIRQDRPLLDLLSENAAITKHVDRKKLSELCDPSNYLGLSGVMVDRVLERIRAAPLIKGV